MEAGTLLWEHGVSSKMMVRDIEQRLSAHCEANHFVKVLSEGPVSGAFPDTFVPSALHSQVIRAAQRGPDAATGDRRYGCEQVFRHIDEGRVGDSGRHLSSFSMFVFYHTIAAGACSEPLRAEVVMRFLELVTSFGIPAQELLITYFGGGCIRGRQFGADDSIADVWRTGGVLPHNVVPVSGGANFTNLDREGEPAGPRCEVFWSTTYAPPIEIGTVVFEKFIRSPAEGLVPSAGLVYGGAVGVERLQAVLLRAANLFDLPEIRPMIQLVELRIHPQLRELQLPNTRQLVDGVRTLVGLISQIHEPLSGARAARLRRIGRRCQRSLDSLGIEEAGCLVHDLIQQAMEVQEISGQKDLQEDITRLICLRND